MTLEQAQKRLGAAIRRLREAQGFTQEEMRSFGFNYRYFQKIEAGFVNPTLGTLLKLSKALKCPMSDLVK